ncbi:PIF1-like helicase-domain-containing protein, partial [Lactarius deliciosus]
NSLLREHAQFDRDEELRHLLQCLPMLNANQTVAFNRIMKAVEDNSPKTFFVVEAAGAGKSFLCNTLCHTLQSPGLVVLCVAYSGIAVQLLLGGKTAH